jgi:hypothetical protein
VTKWDYGDSWERYPIEPGEVWRERKTGSVVQVHDLFYGVPSHMGQADMIYCDPPWNTGNINSFYTKAGIQQTREFLSFADFLFDAIARIRPAVCYLEIGKQHLALFEEQLAPLYPYLQTWPVTYYRRNRSYLVRGGLHGYTSTDFTDMDDMHTPRAAMMSEQFECVGDLCMGRGLTGITAYQLGKRFVGTELNKRRLAVLIDKVATLGGEWEVVRDA